MNSFNAMGVTPSETVGELLSRWDVLTEECFTELQSRFITCNCNDAHLDYRGPLLDISVDDFLELSGTCYKSHWMEPLLKHTVRAVRQLRMIDFITTDEIWLALSCHYGLDNSFEAFQVRDARGFGALAVDKVIDALTLRLKEVEEFDRQEHGSSSRRSGGPLTLCYAQFSHPLLTDNETLLSWAVLHEVVHSEVGFHVLRIPTYLLDIDCEYSDNYIITNLGAALPEDDAEVLSTASTLCEELPFPQALKAARALKA